MRAAQIDLDEATDAEQLAQQLLSGSEEGETAWRNGQWFTARLCLVPLRPEERRTAVVDHERDGMRLQIRTPGDLNTLEFVACDRIPPGTRQIEVLVSAPSINFADALLAMGKFPSFEGYWPQPGMDFAGVVTAVATGVTDHHVGDRVGGVADGCWRTFVTCDANLGRRTARWTVRRPGGSDHHRTRHRLVWPTRPCEDRIRRQGLDPSAMGGVGQAAIAIIARAAERRSSLPPVSPQRRQMLRNMGIEHVYDSRSTEFAEAIKHDTDGDGDGDGDGVDIVLNSVTGAAQRAGIEILSFGGRFPLVDDSSRSVTRHLRRRPAGTVPVPSQRVPTSLSLPTRRVRVRSAAAPRPRLHRLSADHGDKQTACRALNELPPDERPTRLRRLLSDQVSLILRRNIDPDRPLAEYGVDSLALAEAA